MYGSDITQFSNCYAVSQQLHCCLYRMLRISLRKSIINTTVVSLATISVRIYHPCTYKGLAICSRYWIVLDSGCAFYMYIDIILSWYRVSGDTWVWGNNRVSGTTWVSDNTQGNTWLSGLKYPICWVYPGIGCSFQH